MTALVDEITSDPLGLGYQPLIATGDTAGIAALLNVPTRSRVGTVPVSVFAIWCGQTGMRSAIEDAASNTANPLRSIALTLLDLLRGGVSTGLDLGNAGNQAMLSAWQSAGALTQPQRDSLVVLATAPCSRAAELGLPPVQPADIARLLWADDGTPIWIA